MNRQLTRDQALLEAATILAEYEMLERELTEGILGAIRRISVRGGNPFRYPDGRMAPSSEVDKGLKQLSNMATSLESKEGRTMDHVIGLIERFNPPLGARLKALRTSTNLLNTRVLPIYKAWRSHRDLSPRKRAWALVQALGPNEFETIMRRLEADKRARGQNQRREDRAAASPLPPKNQRVRYDPTSSKFVRRRLPGDQPGGSGEPGTFGGGF